jgi:hypothetical protein
MSGELKWIPVRSAAKMLGCSRQRVAKLCKTCQLVSMNVDGTVLVSAESVRQRVAASQRSLAV